MANVEEPKLKNVKILLVAFFTIFLMPLVSASGIDSIGIGGTTSASPGDSVTISIPVVNMDKVGSLQLDLLYNPSVINVASVAQGSAASGATFVPNIDNLAGKVTIGITSTSGLSGSGSIADINFSVIGPGDSTSQLNITVVDLTDPANAPVDTWPDVANSTFYVLGTTTTTTTTTSSTTTTVRSSSGGGGGGGTPTSYASYIKDVSKGGTSSLDIDDEDVPYLIGLSLTTKQDIYSSRLSITDLDKKPYYSMVEPDATVYRYFKVRYDRDSYVENASLDFRVNTSWLEDNNISQDTVRMYRYTTAWDGLDTEFIKEDDKWVYFRAETPGFSYFSIGGETDSGYKSPVKEEVEEVSAPIEEETIEPPKIETPPPAPPVETSPPEQEPVKAPEPEEEKGGICGPTVVVLLAMMVLLFRRRRTLS